MSIVAPLSKYKRNSIIMIFVILLGAGGWFFYDGRYNEKFIEKYTKDGKPEPTLVFNQKSPPYFVAAAVLVAINFFLKRNNKVVADDTGLIIGSKIIDYDKIQSIDKTHFDKKGFFVVTYKNVHGGESELKLSDRTYDNLPAVLDELIRQIS